MSIIAVYFIVLYAFKYYTPKTIVHGKEATSEVRKPLKLYHTTKMNPSTSSKFISSS